MSAGGADVFVLKLSAAGDHVWSKRFGAATSESLVGLAADSSGNILLTGSFTDDVSFGGTALTSDGLSDVYLVKLELVGDARLVAIVGRALTDVPSAIAVGADNSVVVAAKYTEYAIYPNGEPASIIGSSINVFKMSASGSSRWSKYYRTDSSASVAAATIDQSGRIW